MHPIILHGPAELVSQFLQSERVAVSDGYELVAVSSQSPTSRWEVTVRDTWPNSPDSDESRIYVVSVRTNTDVFYAPEPVIARWSVTNSILYVQSYVEMDGQLDVQVELENYFRRVELGVPAMVGHGGSLDTIDRDKSDRFRQLIELFANDPPSIPGINVEIDDATFGLPQRPAPPSEVAGPPRFESHGKARVGRLSVSAEDVEYRPASIWTSGNARQGHAIAEALAKLLKEHGILIVPAGDEHVGSWWQRFKIVVHRGLQTKTFQDHMHEFDHRLQMELVDKPAAEINASRSASVAELLTAIADADEVVMHVYQTVIVKYDGKTFVRTIDAETARMLERSDALVGDPRGVMEIISNINSRLPAPPRRGLPAGTVEGRTDAGN